MLRGPPGDVMSNEAASENLRDGWQEPARDADVILGVAEQRSERILAWLRLGVPGVRVLLQLIFGLIGNQYVFEISFAIYGVATLGALALACRPTHRLWLGWVPTTLDAHLALHLAASLVFVEGWSTSDATSTPGVFMVLLVLAQATVR